MSLVRQSKIVDLLTKLFKTSIFLLLILLDSSDTNTKLRETNVKNIYILLEILFQASTKVIFAFILIGRNLIPSYQHLAEGHFKDA